MSTIGGPSRVLVTGGDPPERERVAHVFIELGIDLGVDRVDVVVVLESHGHGLAGVRAMRERFESQPLIFVADHGSEQLAVEAFRAGANDYLKSPLTPAIVAESLRRLRVEPVNGSPLEIAAAPSAGSQCLLARSGRRAQVGDLRLVGESAATESLRAIIRRVAATPCSVLISGETGTGKDIVARLIHESSERACRPFVTINCSALPDTLFESELFGYERGAFTGAQTPSIGRLQAANGGTVFLDEVGELSLSTQPKLLRAIDQREVQRLGSRRHEFLDVRWVAATNRDLQQSVGTGLFRADLFYRLNVYSVVIPPLRDRAQDIIVLAQAFLNELAAAYGRCDAVFTDAALERLVAYSWPGNVRELRNVVESSVVTSESDAIGPEALPVIVRGAEFTTRPRAEIERVRLVEALRAANGNKSEAAQRLNWSRMTLYRKLARHHIDVTTARDTVSSKPPRV